VLEDLAKASRADGDLGRAVIARVNDEDAKRVVAAVPEERDFDASRFAVVELLEELLVLDLQRARHRVPPGCVIETLDQG